MSLSLPLRPCFGMTQTVQNKDNVHLPEYLLNCPMFFTCQRTSEALGTLWALAINRGSLLVTERIVDGLWGFWQLQEPYVTALFIVKGLRTFLPQLFMSDWEWVEIQGAQKQYLAIGTGTGQHRAEKAQGLLHCKQSCALPGVKTTPAPRSGPRWAACVLQKSVQTVSESSWSVWSIGRNIADKLGVQGRSACHNGPLPFTHIAASADRYRNPPELDCGHES